MEKVDALIEALAEYIIEKISAGDVYSEVAEETKALAELISARAKMQTNHIRKECGKSAFLN